MKTKVLLILLVFISTLTFAQRKVADKFFKNYAYIKASELYEDAVRKGDSSMHVLTRLGDSYYNNSNSKKAAKWYKKALLKFPNIESEYIFKYIQTQRSLGNFEEAGKWLRKFQEIQISDSRVKGYNPDDIEVFAKLASMDDDIIVDIENLSLNTEFSDFGAYIHGQQFYFTSARNLDNNTYKWTGEPFLDIFVGEINRNDNNNIEISNISSLDFNERLGKDIHEGTISITSDGKTMYFTRVNTNKRNKLDFDKKGTSHLKIYRATFENNNWGNIVELPFNNEMYSTGNPALSPDNTKLYFVSDKDGGFGQTDIYVVDIFKGNTYSEPKNLGSSINTEGREMFPFIAKDSTLYFSSDGYLNLGLLDIFKSNILKGNNATPENLGAPFSSGADDFAFFIDLDDQTGYFSSNRQGGKGNDDIYSFISSKCKQTVNGIARNLDSNEPLTNVVIQLINETGKIVNSVTTSSTGEYNFEVDCNKNYNLRGYKPDFKDDVKSFSSTLVNNYEQNVDLFLEYLIKVPCEIVINPIFFAFDKWNIRTDSKYELENIVDVMREHPTMIIKIEAHTDSRGSSKYNMKLSDRRAKSTRDYLLSRGIDESRIESAIGYGESQLLNECSNGVKCSKKQHEVNRRSYFKIVNCDKSNN